jgi:hypothetical protein
MKDKPKVLIIHCLNAGESILLSELIKNDSDEVKIYQLVEYSVGGNND